MKKHLRWKKMIKWSVQGPILTRLIGYFLAYNAAAIILMLGGISLERSLASVSGDDSGSSMSMAQQVRPILIAFAVMLPIMIWELLKLTNRIAGPIYRFENALAAFVRTGTMTKVHLRKEDLTQDLESQFNEFVEAMHALYPETAATEDKISAPPVTPDPLPLQDKSTVEAVESR